MQRFGDNSILTWFQRVWNSRAKSGNDDLSERLLGQHVYGFNSLFDTIERYNLPVPCDHYELARLLNKYIYAEGSVAYTPEVLQVLTDDDELELRYYFIDNSFIRSNPNRCAFLVHEGTLPSNVSKSHTEPCTYFYVHAPEQTVYSQVWDRVVAPGVRLDNLSAAIEAYQALPNVKAESVRRDLISLKFSVRSWRDALSVIAQKDLGRISGLANESILDCAENICQLQHHAATTSWRNGKRRLFQQIIVFDDLWAASYPELVTSIDFYARDAGLI